MDKLTFLIFDLDDTLLKSNIDYNLIKSKLISIFPENKKFDISLGNLSIKNLLDLLQSYDPEKLSLAYKTINDIESESSNNPELLPFADKIPELLKEFGLSSAILTNNSKITVKSYLKRNQFSFLSKIGEIFTRDEVPMKPDPNGLNFIISKYNLNKNEVIFFGGVFYYTSRRDETKILAI